MLIRCIPLIDHGSVTGAVVLTRDISELRRRDRLLLSKDATIREIHHRVKNNLQTISSLLRLQGRRFESPEAKLAIEESVRRIRSIALVHEILSREAGDDVAFIEIVRPLVRMVEEGMSSPRPPGDASTSRARPGVLPATVATPLAVVLNELLQNAIDHAFPAEIDLQVDARARWWCACDNDGERLRATVIDDGVGLPEGFDLDRRHGPRPVDRAHARDQRAGRRDLARARRPAPATAPGTVVRLDVPVAERE